MLVDDNDTDNFISKRIIEITKFAKRVEVKGSGKAALDYLRENQTNPENLPSLIFLDINMPYVDGWMFLADYAMIKYSLRKDIQIFMISSSIDQRDIVRAQKNSDVRDYIVKPVSPEKFRDLVA